MKTVGKWLRRLAFLLLALALVTPAVTGLALRHFYPQVLQQIDTNNDGWSLVSVELEGGWFSSQTRSQWNDEYGRRFELPTRLLHGPWWWRNGAGIGFWREYGTLEGTDRLGLTLDYTMRPGWVIDGSVSIDQPLPANDVRSEFQYQLTRGALKGTAVATIFSLPTGDGDLAGSGQLVIDHGPGHSALELNLAELMLGVEPLISALQLNFAAATTDPAASLTLSVSADEIPVNEQLTRLESLELELSNLDSQALRLTLSQLMQSDSGGAAATTLALGLPVMIQAGTQLSLHDLRWSNAEGSGTASGAVSFPDGLPPGVLGNPALIGNGLVAELNARLPSPVLKRLAAARLSRELPWASGDELRSLAADELNRWQQRGWLPPAEDDVFVVNANFDRGQLTVNGQAVSTLDF